MDGAIILKMRMKHENLAETGQIEMGYLVYGGRGKTTPPLLQKHEQSGVCMKHLYLKLALLALLGFVTPSFAHHASAPHFDESVEIVLEGTVTEWKFVNPHSYIYFDVTDETGKSENWRCEMHARSPMQRNGFTDETFFAGQKLTLTGSPARREPNVCGLTSFKFSDGTEVLRNGALPEKYQIGTLLEAETIEFSSDRTKPLENGQPNISGYWVRAARGGGPTGRPGGEGGPPQNGVEGGGMGGPPGEGARAGGPPGGGGMGMGGGRPGGGARPQYDSTELALAEQTTYEQIYDNPSISCDITNIFFGWTHDANVNQITQADDKITLLYGYMDYARTIHLNMDKHPANITPSRGGHSIGRWEGQKLIVDTIGFTAGVFNPLNGLPHGVNMTSTETFEYDAEANSLNRSYTIEDPEYLNSAFTNSDSLVSSEIPYSPYDCIELSGDNNRRPGTSPSVPGSGANASGNSANAAAGSTDVSTSSDGNPTSSFGLVKTLGIIGGILLLILVFAKSRKA